MNTLTTALPIWSAPAERSGDGALVSDFGFHRYRHFRLLATNLRSQNDPKRRRRCALPPHSKLSVQIEVVFQLHVDGYRLSVAGRRNESNLPRGHDRFFRQTAAQRLHRTNVRDLSRARKDHAQYHRAGNLIAPRFLGVLRLRFGNDSRTYIDLRLFEGPINVVVWIVAGRSASSAASRTIVVAADIAFGSRPKAGAITFANSGALIGADSAAITGTI